MMRWVKDADGHWDYEWPSPSAGLEWTEAETRRRGGVARKRRQGGEAGGHGSGDMAARRGGR